MMLPCNESSAKKPCGAANKTNDARKYGVAIPGRTHVDAGRPSRQRQRCAAHPNDVETKKTTTVRANEDESATATFRAFHQTGEEREIGFLEVL
jgi:hypothetical protein